MHYIADTLRKIETSCMCIPEYQSPGDVQGKDFFKNLDDSLRNPSLNNRNSNVEGLKVTAKDAVLRRCGQAEVVNFEEFYPPSLLKHCQKIGEGVYGEVFLYRNSDGGTTVMKIIPVEGTLIVNGERQKKFDEILSEIIIAQELGKLRKNQTNATSNFAEIKNIRCVEGNYPERLIELWDLYDENKTSENDSPQIFTSEQQYVVLESDNGGQDIESYLFSNALQAFAMFQQTACALAVAETELNFEHRDLHWGNILIKTVDKTKTVKFRLEDEEIDIDTYGVEVTIIDFTLSRVELDGVVIFNDLSLDDELFSADGDYQFEIYKLMQKANGDKWQHFEPYTNILWLHYLLSKVPELRYKTVGTKIHKNYMTKLRKIKEEILHYKSVTEFIKNNFF